MAIEQLLGPISTSTFLETHYLKLPFARAGGCLHLVRTATWATVEGILGTPGVDVLVNREGGTPAGQAPTAAEARALLNEGFTLGIRHAERHDPGLAALADGFHKDFLAPIDIHVYCTPAGHPGFGWHYDAEDVFILQTQGAKEWWLRKNTVNPWPLVETIPADMRYEREIMPVLRCTLEAGDWLYIPAGYWHRTQAGAESISLSVGILSPTGLDAYDFLRTELLSSLRWRQRFPPAGRVSSLSPEELLCRYRALLTELGQDLARTLGEAPTARAFLARLGRHLA